MEKKYEPQDLPDSDLLLKLADVLKQSRRVESVLLAHIAEVDARGLFVRQASSCHNLEFHHDDPYGFGGDRSAKNVRLLCRAHNRFMAEKDYGKEKMDQYRRRAARVRESAPSFSLFPDGVQSMGTFVLRNDLRRAPRRAGT